jgi:hypothetical protein
MNKKMKHCAYCGDEIGPAGFDDYRNPESCGKTECNREVRDMYAQEREEAHDQLDRDMGWN